MTYTISQNTLEAGPDTGGHGLLSRARRNPAPTTWRRELLIILGFYGAIAVFLIYYIRFLGRHSWGVTLAISLITPVVTFLFFDIAMRIVLPKGYLEPLFLPLYDFFF